MSDKDDTQTDGGAAPEADPRGVPPGFAFVPEAHGPRMVYAMRAGDETRVLVHVSEAPRGLHDLVCPDCGGRVVANKGDIRRPHYSHYRRDECAHVGETAIHLLAKSLIVPGADKLFLPPVTFEWEGRTIEHQDAAWAGFDRVDVEKWEDGVRPDLIGIRDRIRGGASDAVRLIIEIRVTHAVDREKRAELRRRQESVIEIDLSGVDRKLTRDALKQVVLREAPREWLHHRGASVARRRLEEARKAERARLENRREQARQHEARREEERARARHMPPQGADPEEIARARDRMRNWEALRKADTIRGAGDLDGIFDVERDVWRAAAFDWAAPWHDAGVMDDNLPLDTASLARHVADKLRQKGWVKPAFLQVKRDWDGRKVIERDLVFETVQRLFETVSRRCGLAGEADPMSIFRTRTGLAWRELRASIKTLDRLREAAELAGFDLCLEGRVASPLEEEMGTFVARTMARGGAHLHRMKALTHEITHGHPEYGRRILAEDICRHGIALLPCPSRGRREVHLSWKECLDLTRRTISIAATRHEVELAERLEVEARSSARQHVSDFHKRVGSRPGLAECLPADLLTRHGSEDAVMARLRVTLDMDSPDPLGPARREIGTRMQEMDAELHIYEALGDLVSDAGDPETGRMIARSGLACLARTGPDGHAALRLGNPEILRGAKRIIGEFRMRAEREGAGQSFVQNALLWHPPDAGISVLDAMLTGDMVLARKAAARIRSDRRAGDWLSQVTRPPVDPDMLEDFR